MRKSLRAKKRKERIQQKQLDKMRIEQADYTYDKVFTFQHFISVLYKCLRGVGWKESVQKYAVYAVSKMYTDYLSIKNRKLPKPISSRNVKIYERGKERIITPIHVRDRVIQKVLCDYALTPILAKKLIYDNGASLKGKGVSFSRNRVFQHLRNAIKEYGIDFHVLSFDFKDFFNSIPHRTCRKILSKYIYDKEIVNITMDVIKSHHRAQILKIHDPKEKQEQLRKLENEELSGICLGSQVSQAIALIIANDIDHYIKDIKKCKYYYRHMDDGVVFLKTKEELHALFDGMKEISDNLGLEFNTLKTHVTKSSKGFTFLKVRYFVPDSGKIVKNLTRKGITRMRRKLHRFYHKVQSGELTLDNAYDSMQSWLAHSEIASSYKTVKSMFNLYKKLYNGYRLQKKKPGGKNSELLQVDKWAEYRWGCIA